MYADCADTSLGGRSPCRRYSTAQFAYSILDDMTGYTKLFGSIVASTIWEEDNETRIIWITMLAMANQFGEVEASIPGLAKLSKIPIPATLAALEKLSAPDEYSRTKDNEGRRIETIDGGWIILNHAKYRAKASEDDKKDKAAIRQQRRRDKLKNHAPVTLSHAPVTENHASHDKQRQIAEAEAKAGREETPAPDVGIPTLQEVLDYGPTANATPESCTNFFNHKQDNNLWLNRFGKLINWRSGLRTWAVKDRAMPQVEKKNTLPAFRQLEALKDKFYSLPANRESARHDPKHRYTDAEYKEVADLRKEIEGFGQ